MPLATREIELVLIARDRASATIARVGGAASILGAGLASLGAIGVREFAQMSHEAAEFRQNAVLAYTQVDNVAGATVQSIENSSLRIFRKLGNDLDEIQGSYYDLFSTIDVSNMEQADQVIEAFAGSAVAGQAPMKDIGRTTIAWLNALNQPATIDNVNRLLNIQFELVRKGAGEYEEIAAVVGKAIPAFTAAEQTVESFSGVFAFLTRNGLTAAQASTSAARAIELLFSKKGIDGLKKYGIAVSDAEGKTRKMSDVIADMLHLFRNLDGSLRPIEQRRDIFHDIFNQGRIQARRFFDVAIPNFEEFVSLVELMEQTGEIEQVATFSFLLADPADPETGLGGTFAAYENAINNLAPKFEAVNVDTLELGGSLLFLKNRSFEVEEASIALSEALDNIYSPSTQSRLEALGVNTKTITGENASLVQILSRIHPEFDKIVSGGEKLLFLRSVFGNLSKDTEEFLFLALTDIDAFKDSMQSAGRESLNLQESIALSVDQPLTQIRRLSAEYQSLRIDIGRRLFGVIAEALPIVQELTDVWYSLSEAERDYLVKQALLISGIALLTGVVISAIGVFILFLALLKFFAAPLVILGLGIAGLVAAFKSLAPDITKDWRLIGDRANEAFNTALNNFRKGKYDLSEVWQDFFKDALQILGLESDKIRSNLESAYGKWFSPITDIFEERWKSSYEGWKALIQRTIPGLGEGEFEDWKNNLLGKIREFTTEYEDELYTLVPTTAAALALVFGGPITKLVSAGIIIAEFETIKDYLKDWWDGEDFQFSIDDSPLLRFQSDWIEDFKFEWQRRWHSEIQPAIQSIFDSLEYYLDDGGVTHILDKLSEIQSVGLDVLSEFIDLVYSVLVAIGGLLLGFVDLDSRKIKTIEDFKNEDWDDLIDRVTDPVITLLSLLRGVLTTLTGALTFDEDKMQLGASDIDEALADIGPVVLSTVFSIIRAVIVGIVSVFSAEAGSAQSKFLDAMAEELERQMAMTLNMIPGVSVEVPPKTEDYVPGQFIGQEDISPSPAPTPSPPDRGFFDVDNLLDSPEITASLGAVLGGGVLLGLGTPKGRQFIGRQGGRGLVAGGVGALGGEILADDPVRGGQIGIGAYYAQQIARYLYGAVPDSLKTPTHPVVGAGERPAQTRAVTVTEEAIVRGPPDTPPIEDLLAGGKDPISVAGQKAIDSYYSKYERGVAKQVKDIFNTFVEMGKTAEEARQLAQDAVRSGDIKAFIDDLVRPELTPRGVGMGVDFLSQQQALELPLEFLIEEFPAPELVDVPEVTQREVVIPGQRELPGISGEGQLQFDIPTTVPEPVLTPRYDVPEGLIVPGRTFEPSQLITPSAYEGTGVDDLIYPTTAIPTVDDIYPPISVPSPDDLWLPQVAQEIVEEAPTVPRRGAVPVTLMPPISPEDVGDQLTLFPQDEFRRPLTDDLPGLRYAQMEGRERPDLLTDEQRYAEIEKMLSKHLDMTDADIDKTRAISERLTATPPPAMTSDELYDLYKTTDAISPQQQDINELIEQARGSGAITALDDFTVIEEKKPKGISVHSDFIDQYDALGREQTRISRLITAYKKIDTSTNIGDLNIQIDEFLTQKAARNLREGLPGDDLASHIDNTLDQLIESNKQLIAQRKSLRAEHPPEFEIISRQVYTPPEFTPYEPSRAPTAPTEFEPGPRRQMWNEFWNMDPEDIPEQFRGLNIVRQQAASHLGLFTPEHLQSYPDEITPEIVNMMVGDRTPTVTTIPEIPGQLGMEFPQRPPQGLILPGQTAPVDPKELIIPTERRFRTPAQQLDLFTDYIPEPIVTPAPRALSEPYRRPDIPRTLEDLIPGLRGGQLPEIFGGPGQTATTARRFRLPPGVLRVGAELGGAAADVAGAYYYSIQELQDNADEISERIRSETEQMGRPHTEEEALDLAMSEIERATREGVGKFILDTINFFAQDIPQFFNVLEPEHTGRPDIFGGDISDVFGFVTETIAENPILGNVGISGETTAELFASNVVVDIEPYLNKEGFYQEWMEAQLEFQNELDYETTANITVTPNIRFSGGLTGLDQARAFANNKYNDPRAYRSGGSSPSILSAEERATEILEDRVAPAIETLVDTIDYDFDFPTFLGSGSGSAAELEEGWRVVKKSFDEDVPLFDQELSAYVGGYSGGGGGIDPGPLPLDPSPTPPGPLDSYSEAEQTLAWDLWTRSPDAYSDIGAEDTITNDVRERLSGAFMSNLSPGGGPYGSGGFDIDVKKMNRDISPVAEDMSRTVTTAFSDMYYGAMEPTEALEIDLPSKWEKIAEDLDEIWGDVGEEFETAFITPLEADIKVEPEVELEAIDPEVLNLPDEYYSSAWLEDIWNTGNSLIITEFDPTIRANIDIKAKITQQVIDKHVSQLPSEYFTQGWLDELWPSGKIVTDINPEIDAEINAKAKITQQVIEKHVSQLPDKYFTQEWLDELWSPEAVVSQTNKSIQGKVDVRARIVQKVISRHVSQLPKKYFTQEWLDELWNPAGITTQIGKSIQGKVDVNAAIVQKVIKTSVSKLPDKYYSSAWLDELWDPSAFPTTKITKHIESVIEVIHTTKTVVVDRGGGGDPDPPPDPPTGITRAQAIKRAAQAASPWGLLDAAEKSYRGTPPNIVVTYKVTLDLPSPHSDLLKSFSGGTNYRKGTPVYEDVKEWVLDLRGAFSGAHVMSEGLLKVHRGETVLKSLEPAKISRQYQNRDNVRPNSYGTLEYDQLMRPQQTIVNIEKVESNADPNEIGQEIAFELRTL